MTPEAFWKLHPTELWWLIDAKRPRKMYGPLSEDDVADLKDAMIRKGWLRG